MMYRTLFISFVILLALVAQASAQNQNTRQRTTSANTSSAATTQQENANSRQETNSNASSARRRSTTKRTQNTQTTSADVTDPTSRGVVAAFNALIAGIEAANVDAVTSVYWNSPDLVLFNRNGTITRGWKQMRENREQSYPDIKDVKLTVRDTHIQMLGRDAALVTYLWTQSQTLRGTPETVTGRTTLVFRYISGRWKAVHLHTSPDAIEQTRTPANEEIKPVPPGEKP